jgi:hypothetical protein
MITGPGVWWESNQQWVAVVCPCLTSMSQPNKAKYAQPHDFLWNFLTWRATCGIELFHGESSSVVSSLPRSFFGVDDNFIHTVWTPVFWFTCVMSWPFYNGIWAATLSFHAWHQVWIEHVTNLIVFPGDHSYGDLYLVMQSVLSMHMFLPVSSPFEKSSLYGGRMSTL